MAAIHTFDVVLTDGTHKEIRAHYAAVDGGALGFLDAGQQVIIAYGPTAWQSYAPIREAKAQ